ncbi:MAG: flagellin N-terminal helical domain-containing protein [Thermoguttaceae bacterium]
MTRINTNISSLTAQKTLARSNVQLQQALTRLSTGLRINVGKDDPAGLIASEELRSDIISTQKAISNTERANQIIATADSALGQATSLLNDIRGLITEAANRGAMSDDQIAANQLQVDSALEALNRIAQTTSFQGKKLLDGTLDFITSATANFSDITDLEIQQANLGTTGQIDVEIQISAAATQAKITATIPTSAAAVAASVQIDFASGDYITVTANTPGSAANGTTVDFVETDAVAAGEVLVTYNKGAKAITVYVNNASNTAMADINTAINNLADFNSVYTQNGAGDTNYDPNNENVPQATLTGGSDATTGLLDDLVFELAGQKGSEVFRFGSGTSGDIVADAINLVSDAIGVTASFAGTTLTLTSQKYGSHAFVAVNVISEGALGTFESSLSADRATGTDIEATVNGIGATGNGNTLSINTSTLDLTATITAGSTNTIQFSITGGGALFQIGPDVVSNQQARLGITSLNYGTLGGESGRLYQLATGGSAALATDPNTAAEIVDQVLTKITSLRGRLGAFQRTTLETNAATLTDTVEALTAAESGIRDADFAAETASLTRAQILVQSGVSVLAIANSSPQSVLALLRG